MTDELLRIWKELLVVLSKSYLDIYLEGLRETWKVSVMTAGVLV
jgi:hypothetical protein